MVAHFFLISFCYYMGLHIDWFYDAYIIITLYEYCCKIINFHCKISINEIKLYFTLLYFSNIIMDYGLKLFRASSTVYFIPFNTYLYFIQIFYIISNRLFSQQGGTLSRTFSKHFAFCSRITTVSKESNAYPINVFHQWFL